MVWKLLISDLDPNDIVIKRLINEALSAAPVGFVKPDKNGEMVSENTIALLPRHPINGICRLCGCCNDLTKEHIPPKSSGNKERLFNLTLEDWTKYNFEVRSKVKRSIEQGGIYGYTLCRRCNSLTGTLYGSEYKEWVNRAYKMVEGFNTDIIAILNKMPGPFVEKLDFGSKEDGGVKPGAFVRQVLSSMCSLSGSWDLASKYPAVRRIILEESVEKLPEGLEIGMYIYFGPHIRTHGPQLSIEKKSKTWRWLMEIAYPPFAFLMVIASNSREPGLGLLVDNMTEISPRSKLNFSGIIEMGFGWSPYPGDYRSQAAITKLFIKQ